MTWPRPYFCTTLNADGATFNLARSQPQLAREFIAGAHRYSWTLAAEGFRTTRWVSGRGKYLVDRNRYDFTRMLSGISFIRA
ncbi:hypothetical protein [Thalassoglobus sp.]|uniref:hypothetical protein n=1 Tax=Thalassoglobus sp. TaxID=2795869 RepID=UPI003AA90D77